ncbi:MAG: SDR family NAD(P)-dependent oxidoreductase, partial [Chitinispirillaceae bacterium]|nr:SDR family NAD(P)-dependent oxidoreductase [Chitinispirillaceae bacterium]
MKDSFLIDLKGKNCVITGGAGVIGTALVKALGEVGINTAIVDINREAAEKKAQECSEITGGKIIGVMADVLNRESLAEAKKKINDTFGPINFLINGAGGNSPKATTAVEIIEDEDIKNLEKTFFGLELDGFRKVFDLNFIGTLLPTMIFAEDMIKNREGAIINISSMNSYRPLTRIPAYSAAKASINNFTAWLAVHFAHQNVRVNAIAPG